MVQPVTPIFPRNNGSYKPENLPIRKMDTRENTLRSGGFNGYHNPEIAHSVHHGYTSPPINIQNIQALDTISCIYIARHIEECPICSRLYDTDKTLYILAILGLLILCFLMVKRIVKL